MKTMGDLFNPEPKTALAGPVECLGMTFPNDEKRRKHFLGILHYSSLFPASPASPPAPIMFPFLATPSCRVEAMR
jgi:hypothetical protein